MKSRIAKIVLLSSLSIVSLFTIKAQVPEVLDTGSLQQQFDYLQQNTRIYNNYRAVRNDMFLRLKTNVLDSETNSQNEILRLNKELTASSATIDTLKSELNITKGNLDKAIKTKDSFSLFGLQIDKVLYNLILWIIILALVIVSVITFLLYKRSLAATDSSKRDLEEIKEEFDVYKKQSRERQEKLVVNHHKEIMKLKKDAGM